MVLGMVLGIGLLHEPISMEMVLSGVSDLSLILVRVVGSDVVVWGCAEILKALIGFAVC